MVGNLIRAVGAGALLFLCISNAAAEEQSIPSQQVQMGEVIVTASPIIEGNDVNSYGSQVTSVSKEQISDLNAQDLPSALRRVPGVIVSRHNPVGSFGGGEGGAIFIRGQGSSRPGAEIQMLVDGIPKFVSVWTHPLMDILSVDMIDSIEIYKGAQPVLYGNMAFGAVDIQTKRMREEGFYTALQSGYGSHNTWAEVIEHGGKVRKFDYYLIQSYRSSDGHRENADGELQNYFGRVGYDVNDNWNLNMTVTHTNNRADDPGPEDGSTPSDGTFSTEDYFTVATLSNS
ncbi:MAG: TonB-dependent receptor plug domain-containing protein, partial [Syntrophaceae bacterium]|nr:TonB-dependent receptor plug domain-containing protein [Syntrophaceae bacterium]